MFIIVIINKVTIYIETRLFISNFNCEHFLVEYILKQNQQKFRGFKKKISWIFKIFKIEFCEWQIFENSIIHKPSLGSREFSQKLCYWIQTDKQTDNQIGKVYI